MGELMVGIIPGWDESCSCVRILSKIWLSPPRRRLPLLDFFYETVTLTTRLRRIFLVQQTGRKVCEEGAENGE